MKKPRCTYSLDWLQIYCHVPELPDGMAKPLVSPQSDKWGNHRTYTLIEPTEWIKGYRLQFAVKYRKYIVANIACDPSNASNDPQGGAIKLANPILYVADWHFILSDILVTLGWQAKNLTRVDLACDFNYFIGGLHPETFIRKYMTKSADTYIRSGSNQWACYGYKEIHKNTFNSIRWGSRQSGVSVYLYNKSKELEEQKYKPWIVDAWKEAQLNPKNTWRVEISINSSGRGLKAVGQDIIHTLFVDELDTQQSIENIFKVYASRYFSFRRVVRGGAKRKKDMPIVDLLDLDCPLKVKPTTLYQATKSSRAEFQTLRKLQRFKLDIENSQDVSNMALLCSLDDVIHAYTQRSYYAHKCENLQHDMQEEINNNVDAILSTYAIQQRQQAVAHIRTDAEYLQEVSHRIARKVALLAAEGILS